MTALLRLFVISDEPGYFPGNCDMNSPWPYVFGVIWRAAILGAIASASVGAATVVAMAVMLIVPPESVTCSSEQLTIEDGACSNVVVEDGKAWVASWDPLHPGPHEVTLDLGAPREIASVVYVPRLDAEGRPTNGTLCSYDLFFDGVQVATGETGLCAADTGGRRRAVLFVAPGRIARVVRLRWLSSIALGAEVSPPRWASAEAILVEGPEAPQACCREWVHCDVFRPFDPADPDPCCLTPGLRWEIDVTARLLGGGSKIYADGVLAAELPCTWTTGTDKETGEAYDVRDCPGVDRAIWLQRYSGVEQKIVAFSITAYNRFGESPPVVVPACMPPTWKGKP